VGLCSVHATNARIHCMYDQCVCVQQMHDQSMCIHMFVSICVCVYVCVNVHVQCVRASTMCV